MINKKSKGYYIIAAVGFVLFIMGIVLVVLFSESEGIMKTLPSICLGIALFAEFAAAEVFGICCTWAIKMFVNGAPRR